MCTYNLETFASSRNVFRAATLDLANSRGRVKTILCEHGFNPRFACTKPATYLTPKFVADIMNWCARFDKTKCMQKFQERDLIPCPVLQSDILIQVFHTSSRLTSEFEVLVLRIAKADSACQSGRQAEVQKIGSRDWCSWHGVSPPRSIQPSTSCEIQVTPNFNLINKVMF